MLNHCGGCRSFEFEQKTFEHDLVGLTLIEQTDLPLIIKVNPNHYQTLNRLIDVVCPHHIVIGDIFHENQYLEPRNQKLILGLLEDNKPKFSFWCSRKMSDLSDLLDDKEDTQIHLLNSSSWLNYMQSSQVNY